MNREEILSKFAVSGKLVSCEVFGEEIGRAHV